MKCLRDAVPWAVCHLCDVHFRVAVHEEVDDLPLTFRQVAGVDEAVKVEVRDEYGLWRPKLPAAEVAMGLVEAATALDLRADDARV